MTRDSRHGARLARRILRLAAWWVPAPRRREWLERWEAELWTLEASRTPGAEPSALRFATGALPDAILEWTHGWREGWSLRGWSGDVRDTWRRSRRAPLAALASVLVMGLGASAATALFSAVDAILLRDPPGLTDPGRLAQIGRGDATRFDNYSYPTYRDLAGGLASVADIAAWANGRVLVGRPPDASLDTVQYVSANFFAVVGAIVRDGPGLPASDAAGTADPAAVVSDAYWRTHAADIGARGGFVTVNGRSVRVAGVAPPGFVGVYAGHAAPVMWVVLAAANGPGGDRLQQRDLSWLWLVARRRPGVSIAALRSAATVVYRRLDAADPGSLGSAITVVDGVGLRPAERQVATAGALALMGVAGLVLVVAAANVAGLEWARARADERTMAMKLSLGATRARIVRGLLVEQALFSAAGGMTAFAISYWGTGLVRAVLPYDIAVAFEPDARLLAFAVLATALSGVAVSFVPLWRVARPNLVGVLKRGGTGSAGRSWSGAMLVVTELALSVALLASALLLVRSLGEAGRANPGFDPAGVIVLSFRRERTGRDPAAMAAEAGEIVARARAVPGVTRAGLATAVPLDGPQSSGSVRPLDAGDDLSARPPIAIFNDVDAGFFDTLRISLVEGRTFDAGDRADAAPVGIITQALADRLWPGADAVGQTLVSRGQNIRVVGVVGDIKTRSLREPSSPALFLPLAQSSDAPSYLLVGASGSTDDVAANVRRALAPLASRVVITRVEPLAPLVVASLAGTAMAARVAIALAGIALVLAAAGLYGMSASRVASRRREFGVRLALGADRGSIVGLVVRESGWLALAGAAGGLALTLAASALLRRLLFHVSVQDPRAVAATLAVLGGVTLLAAIVPARRASRVDPVTILKTER